MSSFRPVKKCKEHHLFRTGLVRALASQHCRRLDDARIAPNLDAALVSIIDQKEVCFGVIREITLRDVLPVPGIIDKANGPFVEYPKETRRSAPMLNIGLSFGIDCGEKNACLRPNKCSEIRGDTGLPGAPLFHAMYALREPLRVCTALIVGVKASRLNIFGKFPSSYHSTRICLGGGLSLFARTSRIYRVHRLSSSSAISVARATA